MSTTVVSCSHPDCRQAASYKIAARWSDGRFTELKTYGLACQDHLGETFRGAERRQMRSRPPAGETVEEMGIYRFIPHQRDKQLQRLWGLEENYRGSAKGSD